MKQFIEENLDAVTASNARLFSGMIEELDAINRYQQRISAESEDEELVEALTDIMNEEMKHFAMQLELAMRVDEAFRTICEGVLFQDGDVSENGAKAEKKVNR
jgi:hypothetical protein